METSIITPEMMSQKIKSNSVDMLTCKFYNL